jgi:maltooligosyltrehalose trehalohydrolase
MGRALPIFFFTDFHDELATAVREGRRREFAALPAFKDPAQRSRIPDPNAASTFAASIPHYDGNDASQQRYLKFYRRLLALRRALIVPYLPGCRSIAALAVNAAAVLATWQLGNGDQLTIAVNFGDDMTLLNGVTGDPIFCSDDEAIDQAARARSHGEPLLAGTARVWINKA